MKSNETYVPRVPRQIGKHNIRGIDYRISEWGDPSHPLLVLLHGWGDTGSSFQFFVDALQEDWFVVAPDWRGFGETTCRAQSYWFPDYLADLDALLEVYSKEAPARLVGHSMGANIAGLYAGIFPERVAAFVNIEGFGLPETDPANAPGNYRRWIEKGRSLQSYKTYTKYADLAERILKRSPHMSSDKALYVAGLWADADNGDSEQIVLRADSAHRLPNAVQYRRAEAMACWARIAAPVLVVSGSDSRFFVGDKDSKGPQELDVFKASETVVVQDAGHMVHFEQPEKLAAVTENFFIV
jgi:pimeloyl-ACP methyl ester carboxylesterase